MFFSFLDIKDFQYFLSIRSRANTYLYLHLIHTNVNLYVKTKTWGVLFILPGPDLMLHIRNEILSSDPKGSRPVSCVWGCGLCAPGILPEIPFPPPSLLHSLTCPGQRDDAHGWAHGMTPPGLESRFHSWHTVLHCENHVTFLCLTIKWKS